MINNELIKLIATSIINGNFERIDSNEIGVTLDTPDPTYGSEFIVSIGLP